MTTLRELLGSAESIGVWNLVPEKSTIGFKAKSQTLKRFSGAWTSRPRRSTPNSRSGTRIFAHRSSLT